MESSLIHRTTSVKYILVAAEKEKANELWVKLGSFGEKLVRDLTIDMRVEQDLVFVPGFDCPACLIYNISRHSG